ncbi:EF-hand domain-containing protein [Actinomadura scrupuli]|uniref:EF-hand domain-containing protein n=1 Tax=Actinomadura scrupuli TaxID=559629 RepID=UPI003D96D3DB
MAMRVLDRKLERAFAQLDVDGDGRIERDDVLCLGSRLLVGLGEPPTTTKGRRVLDHLDAFWNALVQETGSGGKISAAEFHAGMTAAFIDGDRFEQVFRPAAQAVAALCDTDGDGSIGPGGFRAMQQAFGTSAEDADAAFERLDRDGSQTLTVDELVEAAREFYTGDDPEAAGNWLFGPL